MLRNVRKFGVPLLFLSLLTAVACGRGSSAATAPSALATQGTSSVVLSADPSALRFEAITDPSCRPGDGRGTRLVLVISGDAGASLLGLRFHFTSDGGATVFPTVTPIPGASPMTVPANAIPPLSPIPVPGVAPLPTSMPIPLPQPQRLPFFLPLGCAPLPAGVLVATADVADRLGIAGTSELRVRVSE